MIKAKNYDHSSEIVMVDISFRYFHEVYKNSRSRAS
jgi:hypothetical protein